MREAPRELGQERLEELGLLGDHLRWAPVRRHWRGDADQGAVGSAVHDAVPNESRAVEMVTADCTAGKLVPVQDHDPLGSTPDQHEVRGEGGGACPGYGHRLRAQVGPAPARIDEITGRGSAGVGLVRVVPDGDPAGPRAIGVSPAQAVRRPGIAGQDLVRGRPPSTLVARWAGNFLRQRCRSTDVCCGDAVGGYGAPPGSTASVVQTRNAPTRYWKPAV